MQAEIVAALIAQGRPPTYPRYADLDHTGACDTAYGDDVCHGIGDRRARLAFEGAL